MLRIEHAEVVRWGRASGFRLPLPSDGFVVLYGPNESGKTSLATALAWMIAGPGPTRLLHCFENEGEHLQARLQGQLGDDRLTAEVDVRVPRRQSRSTATDTFNAVVGNTAMSRSDLITRLGVGDFDSYRRFYWVGALEVADGRDLQESVSVQAVFGGVNPFAEADALATGAKQLLGGMRGRAAADTARTLQERANRIDRDMTKLSGARHEWARLEDKIGDATAERKSAESRIAEMKGDLRSLRLAIQAHGEGAVKARDDATRALAGTPAPSEAERGLHAQTTLASRRIGELEARESDLDLASQELTVATNAVDLVWRPLILRDELGDRELEVAETAENRLRGVRSDVDESEAARHGATERKQASEERLNRLTDEWRRHAPQGLKPDDVHPIDNLPFDTSDLRVAPPERLPAIRRPRSAAESRLGIAASVVAAVCFVALTLIFTTPGSWTMWPIAVLGILALGAVGFAVRPRKPLDPEVVDLARRYRDARDERDAAELDLREKQAEFDTALGRVATVQEEYRSKLDSLGTPAELIERFEPDAVTHLKAVRGAQRASTALDSKREETQERLRAVTRLFADVFAETTVAGPNGDADASGAGADYSDGDESRTARDASAQEVSDAASATALLDAVDKKINTHRTADEEARKTDLDLRSTVNYDEAALAHVEISTQEELQRREAALTAEVSELEEKLEETKRRTIDLEADKRRLESPEKTTAELSLRRSTLQARIDSLMVRGLARHLAATLLRDTAERHRTEQQPELLRRTAEMVCRVTDWYGVAVNPQAQIEHDSATAPENLLVEGPRGEHSDPRLSLGAQTLLYLALRLATVERQAESRGVRLPLILDDVLISLDDERAQHCLEVLAEFSERHQMILLTCHESTMQRAKAAGAAVLTIPPA